MPTIDIIIRNKTASAVDPPCIVCGNSDYDVKFDFDDEWQAHNNKIGVFAYNRCGEWRSENVLFEGDTCPVPALHGVRSVWIGVTAGDVRTSTPADVPCRMGATDFSDAPEKPPADIWGQILDKLDTVGTVQRINTVISYDVDRGEYVSSVDFATLLAAAQQPERYIVTAARQEGGAEREYALKEIKQNADFIFLCFFCSIPQYIGARADSAQKDLMQPPVSMMWANATAYTTAKKTYKETGITEVCIKGVSLPTDLGFDVGAHIIVEGVAK